MKPSSPQTHLENFVSNKMVCEAAITIDLGRDKDEADDVTKPTGKIKALATTWGPRETPDGRKFYYTEESFGQWADEMNNGGFEDNPLPIFLNHAEEAMPCGEWTKLEMTEEGMEATGQLYTNTTFVQDLMAIMMNNPMMFSGVSINPYPMAGGERFVNGDGMEVDANYPEKDRYYQITNGGMTEISIVRRPANPKAEIKSLEKFIDGNVSARYLEKILREAGLSKSQAGMTCAILKKERLLRDAGSTQTVINAARGCEDDNERAILQALEEKALLDALTLKESKWKQL